MKTYYRLENSPLGVLKDVHTRMQLRLMWIGRKLDRLYEKEFLGIDVDYSSLEQEYREMGDLEQTVRERIITRIMR